MTMTIKQCPCGSGHERYELRDAAGIFCAFVCEKCEDERRSRFNPIIFDGETYYAVTGDEDDIGRNDE
jgi:hypothetical protein